MLRIVHISDVHLRQSVISDIDDFIMKALLDDLLKFNESNKIDLILLSGDLIDKGAEDFNNDISLALLTFEDKIITPILAKLGISHDRIFIVPGNHDILRKADDDVDDFGLRTILLSTEKVNERIDSMDTKGMRRVIPFKEFERIYYSMCNFVDHEITNFQSSFKLRINDLLIGVTCFNTAWRCFDSNTDKGIILLGERQVTKARNIISDCDIKIAIIHHPLDWLAQFDQNSVINLIQKDYNLLFCGHAHKGTTWGKTDMYGTLFATIAPANWAYNLRSTDRIYHSGFSVVDYDVSNYKIISYHRRYNHQKGCFDPNTDLGDNEGKFVFNFPDSKMLSKYVQENQMSQFILTNHDDEINQHLLSYNTDSKAPKRINDLFVLPRVVSKIEYDKDKIEKEDTYNLEDICRNGENLIIFGIKESGKTILLDKLILEFLNNIDQYHKTPIYIDFAEIGNKRFETIISNYSGTKITDIPDIISTRNIVLMIDNMLFDSTTIHKINRLKTLIDKYDKLQIIATSPIVLEGNLPFEFLDNSFLSTFKVLFLKAFKVREIRELINKWFSESDFLDTPNKLDKVVKLLLTLNLPRTPLAISMFLWIIEHQENYRPINHATMLENFIERMFKKQSKIEIYAEEFDYRNKERLLTDIAFYMFKKNLDNYQITYSEMVIFINNYFIKRRFDFNPIKILDYFLGKGIFIKERNGENYLRFRFTCFFEYFLMKKMDFDDSFREFVLHENNFLHFINEIDYFTGIKRDRVDILNELVRRMNLEYHDINSAVSSAGISFDDFFETQKPLISRLDNTFVKKIESSKPNGQELDEIRDNMLEKIQPEDGIEKKSKEFNQLQKMEYLLILAARVLKNTEETDIENLKADSYKDVLKCSMIFSILYKYFIEDYIRKYQDRLIKSNDKIFLVRNLIPLLSELALFGEMGSSKLSIIIREKMEKDLTCSDITDFEKYISVFLYADLKGKDYKKFIGKFVKSISKAYILDLSLIKIIMYYFFRSESKLSNSYYESIIAELIIQAKGYNKKRKYDIMDYYKDKKRKIEEEENPFK